MPTRDRQGWRRKGDEFHVAWADAECAFGFANGRAGLLRQGTPGPFLSLVGLAAVGRREEKSFTTATLAEIDVVHGRLLATFKPPGWGDLVVRAGWAPCREGKGMDLEVEATASSVGKLRRLEVLVEARPSLDETLDAEPRLLVEPRDRAAAGSSYDGRESDAVLERLTTLEVGRRLAADSPDVTPAPAPYLELAHPDDAARTIRPQDDGGRSILHAIFGFDLEKGVVLRGRLRGVFLADPSACRGERARFLAEPPPLRTS